MKVLDVSGEEAVMVGDHTIDIQAGKRVGMMTIGVLTGRIERGEFERAGADYILREASEVCRLIEGAKGDPA
jgi:phosphoglycolate phosphatase-like HAD superfamily hydrolase